MQSLRGSLRIIRRHSNNGLVNFDSTKLSSFDVCRGLSALVLNSWVLEGGRADNSIRNLSSAFHMESGFWKQPLIPANDGISRASLIYGGFERPLLQQAVVQPTSPSRCFSTATATINSAPETAATPDISPRIKFKRLDKTAKHIMQILDKEAVEEVKSQREIPDIQPGCIVQLRVEVPENKRRVSTVKGIVIARRNAGLNTTFRIRRLVAGVGVESLFPLYSPNMKEIKVLDKKKVKRAKLYHLRDKMNALKKH